MTPGGSVLTFVSYRSGHFYERQNRSGNYARFHQLSTVDLREPLHLDGEVREVGKVRELLPIMQGFAWLRCRHRNNGAEMARSQPPETQVGDLIASAFDRSPDFPGQAGIGHAIKQDGAGIAYQRN